MAMPDRFHPIDREIILSHAPVTQTFLSGDFSKPETLDRLTQLAKPVLDLLYFEGVIIVRDTKINIFKIVGYELGDWKKIDSFLPDLVMKYLQTGWGGALVTDSETAAAIAEINMFYGAKAKWYR
jgi:hypothetical protein